MTQPVIIVSDHCLIHYLERVLKLDLTRHRAEIERACRTAAGGTGRRRVEKAGFVYMLQGNYVTTVRSGTLHKGMTAHYAGNGKASP